MDFFRDVLMSEKVSRSHVAGALEWEARERRRKEKMMRASLSDGQQDVVVVTYASHRELRRGAVDEIEANVNDNKNDKEENEGNESNNQEEKKSGRPSSARQSFEILAQPSVIGMVSQRKVESSWRVRVQCR